MTENEISKILVDVFIKVHSQLGPGLLESVYEMAICYELTKRGINYKKQQGINVYYDDEGGLQFGGSRNKKKRKTKRMNKYKKTKKTKKTKKRY